MYSLKDGLGVPPKRPIFRFSFLGIVYTRDIVTFVGIAVPFLPGNIEILRFSRQIRIQTSAKDRSFVNGRLKVG